MLNTLGARIAVIVVGAVASALALIMWLEREELPQPNDICDYTVASDEPLVNWI